MKTLVSLGLVGGFAFILSNTMAARADEITVLASSGVKAAVVELAPQFIVSPSPGVHPTFWLNRSKMERPSTS